MDLISWLTEYFFRSFFMDNLQKFRQLLGEGKITFNQDLTTLLFNDVFKSELKHHFNKYKLLNTLAKKF